jgi:hypothetical protein
MEQMIAIVKLRWANNLTSIAGWRSPSSQMTKQGSATMTVASTPLRNGEANQSKSLP